ncbi:MAG: hypothetical protein JWN41_47 [Thermoleophilia bacterium]|nr:hypothetical protein [Thermoleophilia bacterium]
MRTRTFIGMIILILVLIVATTPTLLNQASINLQDALHKVGVPGVAAAHRSTGSTPVVSKGGGAVPPQLLVKGFTVNKKNLRDGYSTAERGAVQSYRLQSGSTREALPGQLADSSLTATPVPDPGGVLLDSAGCPMFPANVDSSAVLADPVLAQNYANGIASADNPATCKVIFQTRITAADPSKVAAADATASALERRHHSASRSEATDNVDRIVLYREWQLANELLGLDSPVTKQDVTVK